MEDKKVELSLNLINAVITYLGKQPFEEVFEFINEIRNQAQPQLKSQPQLVKKED